MAYIRALSYVITGSEKHHLYVIGLVVSAHGTNCDFSVMASIIYLKL